MKVKNILENFVEKILIKTKDKKREKISQELPI